MVNSTRYVPILAMVLRVLSGSPPIFVTIIVAISTVLGGPMIPFEGTSTIPFSIHYFWITRSITVASPRFVVANKAPRVWSVIPATSSHRQSMLIVLTPAVRTSLIFGLRGGISSSVQSPPFFSPPARRASILTLIR